MLRKIIKEEDIKKEEEEEDLNASVEVSDLLSAEAIKVSEMDFY